MTQPRADRDVRSPHRTKPGDPPSSDARGALTILRVREEQGASVIEFVPEHRVFSRPSVELMKKELGRVIDTAERPEFIISFDGVEYLSSIVLGALVAALLKVQKRDGQLRIACVTRDLAELFRLTGLRRIFQISETVEAAVRSIQKNGRGKG